jgi:ribosome-binding protein aMBF1 (putative translation factor)
VSNLDYLSCSDCGTPTLAGNDASAVVCGRCTQLRCMGKAVEEEAFLSRFTPEVVKTFRRENGLTQEDLAYCAKVPVGVVRSVEQGKIRCTSRLADYVST